MWPSSVDPQRAVQQSIGEQRERSRPFEPGRQHRVGNPQRQQFGIRPLHEDDTRRLGGGERRAAIRGGDIAHARDCGLEGVVDKKPEELGNVTDGVVIERRRAIETAPRQQHAAGRTGIGAAVTEIKSIAQHRLVLAAAGDAGAGGGGFERQAPPPHPGEDGIGADAGIDDGERGAGQKGSLAGIGAGGLDARPGRKRRQRNAFFNHMILGAAHDRG